MGFEFCLGGSLGGSEGFGFVEGVGPCWSLSLPVLRTGGFGRLFVFIPVLLALYGTGGGAGFCTTGCCPCSTNSSVLMGAPNPLRSGVIAFGTAAPPL